MTNNVHRLKEDGYKVYTVKKELLDVGKQIVKSNQGNEIPMYDLERTICDLVRSRSSIEVQDFNIHAEGPAFFCWIPKLFGKRVINTIHGLDWDREKWRGSVASKFIRGGEKNAVKYADEIIVLSKDVQKYFLETYGWETHFIPNGVNRPEVREAKLITDHFGLEKDSYILFLGRLVPEKGISTTASLILNVSAIFNDCWREVMEEKIRLAVFGQ